MTGYLYSKSTQLAKQHNNFATKKLPPYVGAFLVLKKQYRVLRETQTYTRIHPTIPYATIPLQKPSKVRHLKKNKCEQQ